MRTCAFCKQECDSQIGLSRQLVSTYFGGKRRGVEHSQMITAFFCNEDHRNEFLTMIPGIPMTTGEETQTARWFNSGLN